MSNFCILRIKKLHTDGNVIGSLSHALRTRETENAKSDEIQNNFYFPNSYIKENGVLNTDDNPNLGKRLEWQKRAIAMYRKNLPTKIRKNAVRAVELMMTISPEVMQKKNFNINKYLSACNKWAMDKFGRNNVFFVAYHKDETTPHVSILFTPRDEKGKLNARSFFGGREKMQQLQDDFFSSVGREFGLERGHKGSKLQHQEVKKWYENQKKTKAEIEKLIGKMTFPKKKIGQSQEDYEKEIQKNILDTLDPKLKKLADYDFLKKRYGQLQEHFDDKEKALDEIVKNEVIRKINELAPNIELIKKENETLKNQNSALSEKLDRWEKATPEILETTARVYRERGVNNALEDKEKRRREEDQKAKNTPKTRYMGFSMAD